MSGGTPDLTAWIGRRERQSDVLTARLAQSYAATVLDQIEEPIEGDAAPQGIHWCLCPPSLPMGALGRDGHPATGGFLPPVPLPRRMWAGGRLEFLDALRVGDAVERMSTVRRIEHKQGRSGELWFVTVQHEISTGRGLAVREEQDLVYRAETAGAPQATAEDSSFADTPADAVIKVAATPTLLFRYSALTFNGHRIHYDRSYATGIEGYAGLVVHGPLQAALLLVLAQRMHDGVPPRRFSFRGQRPLIDGGDIICKGLNREGGADLWTGNDRDNPHIRAEAEW